MSGHTPGPWHHSDASMWACVTSKPGGHGDVIAEAVEVRSFGPSADDVRDAEIKANARLIAAAPELLEALKMLASIVGEQDTAEVDDGSIYALALAMAAIAKAEGK